MKDDVHLKKDVEAELEWDASVNAAQVGVAVKNGVVTLTGHLDTYAEKAAIERAVQRVQGVQAIAVELDVKLAPGHVRSDTEIAAAAEYALLWHAQVPTQRITVKVDQGRVTLSGDVDWEFQRREAESAIHPLTGVVGIRNNIELRAKATPLDIGKRIREALTRQAERESELIRVDVSGQQVTLRGTVHSWAERAAAQGAAWSAPGVDCVVNELRVSG